MERLFRKYVQEKPFVLLVFFSGGHKVISIFLGGHKVISIFLGGHKVISVFSGGHKVISIFSGASFRIVFFFFCRLNPEYRCYSPSTHMKILAKLLFFFLTNVVQIHISDLTRRDQSKSCFAPYTKHRTLTVCILHTICKLFFTEILEIAITNQIVKCLPCA